MRVICLTAENFRRLHAIEIKPRGNLVEIAGKNASGKSSALNAIAVALEGMAAAPAVPIRKGASEARITLDLGDVIVKRTFRKKPDGEDTTTLTLENAQGARFPSPQRMLDNLRGQHSLDPLEFLRMPGKAQFDALRGFVPDVDFVAIENANRGDFERRTEINRFAKQERAAAAAIVVPEATPAEPVDERQLIEELSAAGENNAESERRQANRERTAQQALALHGEANSFIRRAEELERQAVALREQASERVTEARGCEQKLKDAPPLPARIDTAPIRARIEAARAINANVEAARQRVRHWNRAEQLEQQAGELTAAIETRNAGKVAAIAAAKMPVEGLGFGDGVVLLNALPLAQASAAEQLRASVAIAMALKPRIKVIWIHDASLLDDDSMRIIEEMANTNDCQVWLERVQSTSRFGFVLEDGRLAGAEEEQAKAANA